MFPSASAVTSSLASLVVVAVVLVAVAGWALSRRSERPVESPRPETQYLVTMDAEGVRSCHPQRPDEIVRWRHVTRVNVVTTSRTSEPPHLFLHLHEAGGLGATVPLGAPGADQLLELLGEVDDFDMQQVIEAQDHDGDEVFPCWSGKGLPIGSQSVVLLEYGARVSLQGDRGS